MTLGEVWDGSGMLREVWDGSEDPWGGQERGGRLSGRSGTGRGTHREVWDGSEDPQGGPAES